MTTYYTAIVPVEGNDGQTRFRRVGALFKSNESSKTAFNLKLDFPIGVTELVFFEPKDAPDEE